MDRLQPNPADSRLYTAHQVRELDRCAIEDHGIAGLELMERAGKAVFDVIRMKYPETKHWMIVCGGGNNAGDGYVVARLAREADIACQVFALRAPDELKGDAALAARKWIHCDGGVQVGSPPDTAGFELIVDALLGTGLDRAAEGKYAQAINTINAGCAPVVAVDIPSGLNPDTGCAMGHLAVKASLTVTFIGMKRGLFTADGPDYCGTVCLASLELSDEILNTNNNTGLLIHENIIKSALPKRLRNSHKGHYGWLLGIGGDYGMGGALRLCGQAALRSGAGKITLLTHPVHANTLNTGCPELMVRGISNPDESRPFLEQANVVVLGTGLGTTDWSRTLFKACGEFHGPLVLDADALNLWAEGAGPEGIKTLQTELVITPHPAEAARLLKTSTGTIQGDRVGAAQELAQRSQAIVVLKGCGTVVASPDGDYAICPLGNPGMATGGTGDVLAGVIGAMLAQGLDAWTAATVGVVAHAAAGDLAAAKRGERGLIASDIVEHLPRVLNPAI